MPRPAAMLAAALAFAFLTVAAACAQDDPAAGMPPGDSMSAAADSSPPADASASADSSSAGTSAQTDQSSPDIAPAWHEPPSGIPPVIGLGPDDQPPAPADKPD
jgi:hypothetical protein